MATPAEALKRPWAAQGRNLKAARKLVRLSQENFAPEIGTTRRHLIRLENGEHRPSGELLGRIAERTGKAVDEFGYPSADDEEEDPWSLMLRAVQKLAERDKAAVA